MPPPAPEETGSAVSDSDEWHEVDASSPSQVGSGGQAGSTGRPEENREFVSRGCQTRPPVGLDLGWQSPAIRWWRGFNQSGRVLSTAEEVQTWARETAEITAAGLRERRVQDRARAARGERLLSTISRTEAAASTSEAATSEPARSLGR